MYSLIPNHRFLVADEYIYTLHFCSCAPVWGDPSGASYIIYLLVVGWGIPNLIIILSAIEVLRYQRKVYYGKFYIINSDFKTCRPYKIKYSNVIMIWM